MSGDYVEQTTALIGPVAGRELLPHAVRLLADGEPVAVERLAAAGGWAVEDVALLQLDRGDRGVGRCAPRWPHPSSRGGLRA